MRPAAAPPARQPHRRRSVREAVSPMLRAALATWEGSSRSATSRRPLPARHPFSVGTATSTTASSVRFSDNASRSSCWRYYDMRAYRFARELEGRPVFEVGLSRHQPAQSQNPRAPPKRAAGSGSTHRRDRLSDRFAVRSTGASDLARARNAPWGRRPCISLATRRARSQSFASWRLRSEVA
jgi:hypothetical protein